jgi:hypothetical protein
MFLTKFQSVSVTLYTRIRMFILVLRGPLLIL